MPRKSLVFPGWSQRCSTVGSWWLGQAGSNGDAEEQERSRDWKKEISFSSSEAEPFSLYTFQEVPQMQKFNLSTGFGLPGSKEWLPTF